MAPIALTPGEESLARLLESSSAPAARRAAEALRRSGLPSRRVEAWKYSDLRAALTLVPAISLIGAAETVEPASQARDDIIGLLAAGLAGSHPDIAALDILHSSGGDVRRITVPAGGAVTLTESFEPGGGAVFTSLEADVGPGGRFVRIVRQRGGPDDLHLATAHVRLAQDARFEQFVLGQGAKLARIETHVSVEGAGAFVVLNAAYLAGPGRHFDLTSTVEHRVAGARTSQLVKGVAAARGRGVFQGRFVVHPGADQTDARQRHAALLLEEGAEVFAKPELMIFADDVQCAHGNTAGALDETALFYMRQRGVPRSEARKLLVEAFLLEALDALTDDSVRAGLANDLSAALAEMAP